MKFPRFKKREGFYTHKTQAALGKNKQGPGSVNHYARAHILSDFNCVEHEILRLD